MSPQHIDLDYTVSRLMTLLAIPSPTGFTDAAMRWLETELSALGIQSKRTTKGALLWSMPGNAGPARCLSAHVDTLGAMVKEIKDNGRLALTQIGGYDWATIEGEYCLVHTNNGKEISGTIVNTKQSLHVWGQELHDLKRDAHNIEVRLDATTSHASNAAISKPEHVHALGIEVGDFVSFAPRNQITTSGHIKSRHIDNKAACAIFLAVARAVKEQKIVLAAATHFFISNYEEVGHGAAAGIPTDTAELIAVDMAAIGKGQNSSEHHVSLCLKDSSGPYDHNLGLRLRQVAKNASIELRTDVYPYYGSDASAAWRAGLEARAALIGPGVDASHAYERTHKDALLATGNLLLAYLQN